MRHDGTDRRTERDAAICELAAGGQATLARLAVLTGLQPATIGKILADNGIDPATAGGNAVAASLGAIDRELERIAAEARTNPEGLGKDPLDRLVVLTRTRERLAAMDGTDNDMNRETAADDGIVVPGEFAETFAKIDRRVAELAARSAERMGTKGNTGRTGREADP